MDWTTTVGTGDYSGAAQAPQTSHSSTAIPADGNVSRR